MLCQGLCEVENEARKPVSLAYRKGARTDQDSHRASLMGAQFALSRHLDGDTATSIGVIGLPRLGALSVEQLFEIDAVTVQHVADHTDLRHQQRQRGETDGAECRPLMGRKSREQPGVLNNDIVEVSARMT